jgi:hypothetical protein
MVYVLLGYVVMVFWAMAELGMCIIMMFSFSIIMYISIIYRNTSRVYYTSIGREIGTSTENSFQLSLF